MSQEDAPHPLYAVGKALRIFSRACIIASVIFLVLSFVTTSPTYGYRGFLAALIGLVASYFSGYLRGRFEPPEKISVGDKVHAPMTLWEVVDIWHHDGREMLSIKPVVEVVFMDKQLVALHEHEGKEVH